MYKISVEDTFSAAHFLRNYKGKCERLHGHNWRVTLRIAGNTLKTGQDMLMDFSEAKKHLSRALSVLDHRNLNEIPPFDRINPSAENIARYIFEKITSRLKKTAARSNIRVASVSVRENEKTEAEYSESEN